MTLPGPQLGQRRKVAAIGHRARALGSTPPQGKKGRGGRKEAGPSGLPLPRPYFLLRFSFFSFFSFLPFFSFFSFFLRPPSLPCFRRDEPREPVDLLRPDFLSLRRLLEASRRRRRLRSRSVDSESDEAEQEGGARAGAAAGAADGAADP